MPTKAEHIETIARLLAYYGVRNSDLENLHAGTSPSSVTGDYSDVKVVSPYGEIPWSQLSRITDEEMRTLMLNVEEQVGRYLRVLERAGVITLHEGIWLSHDVGDYNGILHSGPTYDRTDWDG